MRRFAPTPADSVPGWQPSREPGGSLRVKRLAEFSEIHTYLNRRVRTRMLGGVGRAVSDDRPYPISPFRFGL
jgi:hypothetical protein